MDFKDWATLAIACVGAGLGCFNTYRAIRRDRPKLVVKVDLEEVAGGGQRLRFNFVNAGYVPVRIAEVRLLSKRAPKVSSALFEASIGVPAKDLHPDAPLAIEGPRIAAGAIDTPNMRAIYAVEIRTPGGRRYVLKTRSFRDIATKAHAAGLATGEKLSE